MKTHHWIAFAAGVAVGYLILPMILNMVSGNKPTN